MNIPMQTEIVKARVATSFIFLVCGLAYSSWAPMIPYVKDRLDLGEAALGAILLAFGIGALIAMPLTGWAVNRYGSKIISSIVAPCVIMLLPLLATAASGFILTLLLFAFGAAAGALNVSMNSQSIAVEVHAGRPILSGFHGIFSLGGLLGAGTMSLLLESGLTLFLSTVCLVVIMGAIAAASFKHLLPSLFDIRTEASQGFVFPRGKVLFYGTICFILFLAEGSMLDWGAVFLTSAHDYDPSIAGIGYAIFSVAMAIGRFSGDHLIARFGPIFMVRLGAFLAATGLFMTVSLSGNYLELLGFFLIGIGASNIVPIMFGAAGRLPGISASAALTIVITLGYSGMLLGPAFIGWIAEAVTLSFSLSIVAVLLIAVSLSASKITPQEYAAQAS